MHSLRPSKNSIPSPSLKRLPSWENFSKPSFHNRSSRADPSVISGAVKRWYVREWTTVVGEDAAVPFRPNGVQGAKTNASKSSPYTSQTQTELLSLYEQLQKRIQELDKESGSPDPTKATGAPAANPSGRRCGDGFGRPNMNGLYAEVRQECDFDPNRVPVNERRRLDFLTR